jgi:hypothetical protein
MHRDLELYCETFLSTSNFFICADCRNSGAYVGRQMVRTTQKKGGYPYRHWDSRREGSYQRP